ncbi:transglutaminase-like cysteine peptidase [Aureimonas sp. ME7]|uniref:transglutaminase-like cysteine peptidase n=1 Tax=Aureimonas sp. ME7 TaxID=2744252 RepID=UPI0015F95217|nr:transglutaminase-like cysteine peptidase [Aureimonas sp. ME7]
MLSPVLPFKTLLFVSMIAAGPAFAREPGTAARWASLPPDKATVRAGAPTLAPFAHVVFCKSYPAECRTDGRGSGPVRLTAELKALLNEVNLRVNRSIRPVAEGSGPLDDVWLLSPEGGDCDDYAVTKRRELARAGLPVSALQLRVVQTPAGEGHAVLAVRTDRGDMILDNLTGRILEWSDTRLTLVKFQSATDPRRWFRPHGNTVASID